jgi:hypothetical protein
VDTSQDSRHTRSFSLSLSPHLADSDSPRDSTEHFRLGRGRQRGKPHGGGLPADVVEVVSQHRPEVHIRVAVDGIQQSNGAVESVQFLAKRAPDELVGEARVCDDDTTHPLPLDRNQDSVVFSTNGEHFGLTGGHVKHAGGEVFVGPAVLELLGVSESQLCNGLRLKRGIGNDRDAHFGISLELEERREIRNKKKRRESKRRRGGERRKSLDRNIYNS